MTRKHHIVSGAASEYNPIVQSVLTLTHNSSIHFFITQENYMTHCSLLATVPNIRQSTSMN